MSKSASWLKYAAGSVVAGATLASAIPSSAASLTFAATPVKSAVSQLNGRLHTVIVVGSGIDTNRTVSFAVADTPGTSQRKYAVVSLARQLHAQYRKVLLVRRHSAKASAIAPIDNDATLFFRSRKLPAKQAINMIAGTDEATARFEVPVKGYITLSSRQISTRQAASEIARQTNTTFVAMYVLQPADNQSVPTEARVIGHTRGGQPITAMPPDAPTPAASSQPTRIYAHRTDSTPPAPAANAAPINVIQTPPAVYATPAPPYSWAYPFGYNPYSMPYSGPSSVQMPGGITIVNPGSPNVAPYNPYFVPYGGVVYGGGTTVLTP